MNNTSTLLVTKDLSYQATNGAVLLQPTNIRINARDRIGIHGLSGSGKSVFLRTLALLNCPTSGDILWQGNSVAQLSGKAIQQYRTQVAYVQQQPTLITGTVTDNPRLPYQLSIHQNSQADPHKWHSMLAQIDRSDDFLQKNADELSGGERQLVCLMRILQLSPQLLLLDEPTAALDPESTQQVEQLIQHWLQQDQQHAYLWISHSPEQLERIACQQWQMHAGKLTIE